MNNLIQLYLDINAIGTFPQVSEVMNDLTISSLTEETYYKNILLNLRLNRGSSEIEADHFFNKLRDAIFPEFIWEKNAIKTCVLTNPISITGECLIVNNILHEIMQDFLLDDYFAYPIKILNHKKKIYDQYYFYVFRYNRLDCVDFTNTNSVRQVMLNGERNIIPLSFNSKSEVLSEEKIVRTLDLKFKIEKNCDLFYIQTPTSGTFRYFVSDRLAEKLKPNLDKSVVLLPTESIPLATYNEYLGMPFLF